MAVTRNDHVSIPCEGGLKHSVVCRIRLDLLDNLLGFDDLGKLRYSSAAFFCTDGFPSEPSDQNANQLGKQRPRADPVPVCTRPPVARPGTRKPKPTRSCQGRLSTRAELMDQPLDVAFVADSKLACSGRTVALEGLETLRLAPDPVDPKHLPEHLALVASLLLRDVVELPGHLGRHGEGDDLGGPLPLSAH